MPEKTEGTPHPAEHNEKDPLANEKIAALKFLLSKSTEFVGLDCRVNEHLERLLGSYATFAEKNPGDVFSGARKRDLDALLVALKSNPAAAGMGDMHGHDIAGGAIDFGDFVNNHFKEILEFLAKEKKFFLAILMMILYGPEAKDCVCDYLKSS